MSSEASPRRGARVVAFLIGSFRVIAIVGLVLASATARVIIAGEREIAASTEALRAGDPRAAAEHARRAAGWYAPGAPHVRVAYERLVALATTAEGLGKRDIALHAWRAVRTAALETRWLVTPHADDLDRANRAIARLSAMAPRPPGTRTEPATVIERQQLEALMRDEAPRAPWVAMLAGAALAWVLGALWLGRRAITATGQIDWRRAAPALVLTGAGIAGWLLAIWRA